VTIEDERKAHKRAWELNNTALKSIRDTHEDPRGFPTTNHIDLFGQDPLSHQDIGAGHRHALFLGGATNAMVMAGDAERHDGHDVGARRWHWH